MADFELTMQDPPRMNERLSDARDLIGEVVLAVFDDDLIAGDMVVVTENRNWIVFAAETDGCGEDAYLRVQQAIHYGPEQTLASFVKAKPLFDAGCINHAVYLELKAKEDEAAAAARECSANYFRRQLEKLEGASPKAAPEGAAS